MPKQTILHIDLETQSSLPLERVGVYKYVEDPNFGIQLMSYAYNEGRVHTIDLAHGEKIPGQVICDIMDGTKIKLAHNASFERICLSKYLEQKGVLKKGEFLLPESWRCTMIYARYFNLPGSLDALCKVLGLPEYYWKDKRGAALMHKYCHAQYKDMSQIPIDDDWLAYKKYNNQDTVAEQAIFYALFASLAKASTIYYKDLFKEYAVSERINDRGIKIDIPFVQKMSELASDFKSQRLMDLQLLCDLYAAKHNKPRITNVNSVEQLQALLEVPSLDRDRIPMFFDQLPNDVKQIIITRSCITQVATQKYDHMLESVCEDGRIRGEFKFYGASTGRFAGNNVQVQNLKKNDFEDIKATRELYMSGQAPVSTHYLDDISSLIRTAIIPEGNNIFSDSDYSAIEARVVAWLAGEEWVLNAFREGRDVYSETASQIYSAIRKTPVKVEKDGENSDLRQVGKIATLTLGFGGGTPAFNSMGGNKLGLTQDQIKSIVYSWRKANPHIKSLWYTIDNVVKYLIRYGQEGVMSKDQDPGLPDDLKIVYRRSPFIKGEYQLEIILPVTHRVLIYPDIRLTTEKDQQGKTYECLSYMAAKGRNIDGTTTEYRTKIYGGKFVENITQGIARDILVSALSMLQNSGYPVVMHVHDEVLAEYPKDCVASISGILASAAMPYEGLPLKAEGYTCDFFMKA